MDKVEYLQTSDAARVLNCSKATVRNLHAAGRLHPLVSTRGIRLFPISEVERLATERQHAEGVDRG